MTIWYLNFNGRQVGPLDEKQAIQAVQENSNDGYCWHQGMSQWEPISQVTELSINHKGSIFISYRREDSGDITGRIYDKLVSEFSYDAIYKDVDNIPFGKDFRKHLEKQVSRCQILLAIIGKDWIHISDKQGHQRLNNSIDFVRIEIESALKRDIPVIPLLVRDADMPDPSQLPKCIKNLSYRHGIQIRRDPDFHNDMNRLIKGIKNLLPGFTESSK